MLNTIKNVILYIVAMTIILGVAYPLVITGIAQVLFPSQANGSIITKNGKTVGSELIGQSFDDPKYFWGRPSATPTFGYNGSLSSGSNLGQNNPALIQAVQDRVTHLKAADPSNKEPVPVDLVTTSGSGLDPHISPAAAVYQVKRVAAKRNLDEAKIIALIQANTEGRTFWLLGEPRVNVLKLNIALDNLK